MSGRTVVGLDIGTAGVRAAEVSRRGGVTKLERFGQVVLPAGAVRDGEVVEAEVVGQAIAQLWSQAKFRSRTVVVGVANQKVVVRQVDLPWLPVKELRQSLAFQVQDAIPMPVEHAVLDFHPLKEVVDDAGVRSLRVLLVAASREMVGSALRAVTLAGLRPGMVDLTSFAVLRSHVSSAARAVDSEALVDIGSSVTNIVVHDGGVPRFVRILLMGGGDITDAVAERLGLPAEEAESVKQTTGLPTAPAGDLPAGPASDVIDAVGGSFVEEVRGTLDYYTAQPGAARPSRIVLSGGGARLAGLVERLEAATGLPVELAHPLAVLSTARTGFTADQLAEIEPLATVPLGLALGIAS